MIPHDGLHADVALGSIGRDESIVVDLEHDLVTAAVCGAGLLPFQYFTYERERLVAMRLTSVAPMLVKSNTPPMTEHGRSKCWKTAWLRSRLWQRCDVNPQGC